MEAQNRLDMCWSVIRWPEPQNQECDPRTPTLKFAICWAHTLLKNASVLAVGAHDPPPRMRPLRKAANGGSCARYWVRGAKHTDTAPKLSWRQTSCHTQQQTGDKQRAHVVTNITEHQHFVFAQSRVWPWDWGGWGISHKQRRKEHSASYVPGLAKHECTHKIKNTMLRKLLPGILHEKSTVIDLVPGLPGGCQFDVWDCDETLFRFKKFQHTKFYVCLRSIYLDRFRFRSTGTWLGDTRSSGGVQSPFHPTFDYNSPFGWRQHFAVSLEPTNQTAKIEKDKRVPSICCEWTGQHPGLEIDLSVS